MDETFFLELALVFFHWTVPMVMVLSLVLLLKPKLFTDLEKKLSLKLGSKKISRKTIEILEKENFVLQQALIANHRLTGIFCFVLSIIIMARLF